MEILINATATRVWRDANTLQIGFGKQRVVLENLQLRHEKFIEALYFGLTPEQATKYARHLKMRSVETQALITALGPVLVKNTTRLRQGTSAGFTVANEFNSGQVASIASVATDDPIIVDARGEINSSSRLHCARGESVWLRRQNKAVFVSALDKTGLTVAESLATAGVGALVVGETNQARVDILKQHLGELSLQPQLLTLSDLTENQIARIDLAILLGQQLIVPQRFAAWMNRHTPHIAAIAASVAEDLQPLVSHVIISGASPCWHCLEQQRKNSDTAWPDMACQLVGREMSFDSASARLLLAGTVVEKTLGFLDHKNGFGEMPSDWRWNFSVDCGCVLAS